MFNFLFSQATSVDQKGVENVLTRGVEAVFPSRELFKKELLSGRRLKFYLGIDPTGPTLHLGHATTLRKLSELQNLGHKVVLLVGDFTATVGDPTGKLSTRRAISKEDVERNCATYQKQASSFLKFSGPNKASIKYNSSWLSKMNLESFVRLLSEMTVDQMLKRDMFEERRKTGEAIFMHEFIYPLLQGYDSVALLVDGEVGGNDQTFNMLVGRDLLKVYKGKDKFILSTKLLTDASGKKMGKTEGNMVALSDSPEDIFGKIMSWTDGMILPGLELLTDVSTEKLSLIKESLVRGDNPKSFKEELAFKVVEEIYGVSQAEKAKAFFGKAFVGGEIPEGVAETRAVSGTSLKDALVSSGAVSSSSDFRRLVEAGAVEDSAGYRISDPHFRLEKTSVYKVGKRRFIKIVIVEPTPR